MQRCGQLFKTLRVVAALPVTQETSCSRRSSLTRPEALGKHVCHFAKKSLKTEAFFFQFLRSKHMDRQGQQSLLAGAELTFRALHADGVVSSLLQG